ncbi:MAG: ATP phosphoribosyltransferase [SAR86 cluster bacterium]|uniref:ATP phosphoribosyltransferase n=1 Tax=SAR86 cluster bacterium TaxID=2030880 RepID=A0A520MYR2_9GAMM|nr:MAG: ATP phosphoribosyltransferase [Gammaproteobacteria bacterium TMED225]RZO26341.1 MAG: ATP phosphoribosyltransferase [SAR86 cluster bacterium]|tara:strand:+ start:3823 stop:4689 length:867 start_codon:yes stop_codon:yes gene_type:complete
MENRVKIAVQKSGRLSKDSLSILKKCGIEFSESSNKLFIKSTNMSIDLLMVRDDDIPKLVSQNIADLGIVGENVVKEKQLSDSSLQLNTLLKLGFSKCRLSFAKPKEMNLVEIQNKKIATSYPAIVKNYLDKKNVTAEIIEIHGSVELTPFVDISDIIVDLVSTGSTLESNNLTELETVMNSQAILIQSKKFPSEKQSLINTIISRVNSVIEAKDSKYIMFNANTENAEELINLLPSAESPTVIPLADKSKVAIHSVCKEDIFWNTIESLKSRGATSVLVLPIEKLSN